MCPFLLVLSGNWQLCTSEKQVLKIAMERSIYNCSSLQGDMNKILIALIDKVRAKVIVVYETGYVLS